MLLFGLAAISVEAAATATAASSFNCQWYGLWPYPANCTAGDSYTLVLSADRFEIESNVWGSAVLTAAVQRARINAFLPVHHVKRGNVEPHLVQRFNSLIPSDPAGLEQFPLRILRMYVTNSSESPKTLSSDESFALNITTSGAFLSAPTIWGALYGLEAFAQLVTYNPAASTFAIHGAPVTIHDRPRFPWRGLLLDSANHFLSVPVLETMLEAMSMDRFNVLHWHLVDSYSFPFASARFPALAEAGRWAPGATYSPSDVARVVAFAGTRGVRVVVEVDVPGHASAWGLAFPNITVPCAALNDTDIGPVNCVPFDPTVPFTFTVIEAIMAELAALVPDPYFHIGGDELQYECWLAAPHIVSYMMQHNMSSVTELQAEFEKKILAFVTTTLHRTPIVWADTFAAVGSVLPPGAVVEVWDNVTLLDAALAQGLQVLLADGWYLDRQVPVDGQTAWFWQDTWTMMYNVSLTDLALGGEANMWGEQVADSSIIPRVWPRASAVAERLWSRATVTDAGLAAQRLSLHRCAMATRGIAAGALWASYCQADQPLLVPVALAKQHVLSDDEFTGVVVAAVFGGFALAFFGIVGGQWVLGIVRSKQRQRASSAISPIETEPLLLVRSKEKTIQSVARSTDDRRRLSSLDVFRGVTVALMIFVDNVGAAFPEVDHSPWDGIRLADFVMPFFDFAVGVSLALSFKRFNLDSSGLQKWEAARKATVRFLKLFFLGLFTQGGINFMEYNVSEIRIMGILQRVAVCYFAVALMEIFLPRRNTRPLFQPGYRAVVALFSRYAWHWLAALSLLATHTGIMYGVDVPPQFGLPCGRGALTPACNAATFVDRHLLTVPHMYFPSNGGDPAQNGVTFQRVPECSGCSPGSCAPAPGQTIPEWCTKGPFDPEGLVSSLNAILTTVIGAHIGHALVHYADDASRLRQWLPFSFACLIFGLVLHFAGVPMNTDLYSFPFVLVTGGVAGIFLSCCYVVVDMRNSAAWIWRPFMFFGMNAIAMYVGAEAGPVQWVFSCFYVHGDPDQSLANILWPTGIYWGDPAYPLPAKPTHNPDVMSWTIGYIVFWMIVSYVMWRHNYFVVI